ncbi:MAG: DUF177 domain-containing protein [Dehalococcoidales bacterium]|nr:DUF177 domain-containing protein [Dehalococcoidales bacterium]
MQFNVAQLLKEPVGATREYEFHEDADILAEIPAVAPYVGKVRLVHLNEGILATAELDTTIQLPCNRCLQPVEEPLHIEFVETFRPSIDITTGTAVPVDTEDESFTIDEHHILDIIEAVRQYALTMLPLQVLCREKCAGLCPTCGQDLNVAQCNCQAESVDPRLAALGRLLDEDNDKERS